VVVVGIDGTVCAGAAVPVAVVPDCFVYDDVDEHPANSMPTTPAADHHLIREHHIIG
jgi:ferredoxin